ncbi:3'(2'),5'-bisphosphate nucleotidase CysQ [Kangiella shandongensis]|uniref:3'(2'),5'-bisphosphate nucleotidase CysQ n=1 Tax=Kangiella shandongensis TaxID=2763258 RepID=UPI001CBF1A33|nr:3'(2'),5'-bisphosphate nucleotidase CysQ [Kangiella shandongensis]
MSKELLTESLIKTVNHIAIQAGHEIMAVYQKDFEVYEKSDDSPLTEADLASHQYIVKELTELTPDTPILSEESADIDWSERQQWETYWLIDPLDGTKEFIKKNGEFTVNIALISNGKPTFGVVYAPVLDTLYYGVEGAGAKKQVGDEVTSIAVSQTPSSPLRVVGSRSHQSEQMLDYLKQFDDYELVPMGSSLKICLVAEGKADIYPRLGPTSEWDTAAAHAVLSAAGGRCFLYDTDQELSYNTKESLLNPYFIAQGPTP